MGMESEEFPANTQHNIASFWIPLAWMELTGQQYLKEVQTTIKRQEQNTRFFLFVLEREKERERKRSGKGTGREIIPSRLCTEHGA